MSISSLILQNLNNIVTDHQNTASVFSKIAPELRKELIDEGRILPFERSKDFTGSIAAIDGGRASEDLTGGDLMVVGAAIGEGHSSQSIYTMDTSPTEAWGKVLPHKNNNKDIVADVMYALELRVLQSTESDLRIIDGAYLANVSHLLFALAGTNFIDSERIDTLFESINLDEDEKLRKAFMEILYPPRNNSSTIVSLPKSDSAKVFTKEFLNKWGTLQNVISDRILANRILLPGEMLLPRNISSNPALISKLSRLDLTSYEGKYPELYKDIVQEKQGLLTRLDNRGTEEGILWATYFKPHAFSPQSKSLKIEFPYYQNSKEGINGAIAHTRKLIGIIDTDVIDAYILEPWSQYMADVQAKDVSSAINLVKNSLISTVQDSYELAGLLRGYRT